MVPAPANQRGQGAGCTFVQVVELSLKALIQQLVKKGVQRIVGCVRAFQHIGKRVFQV